MKFWLFAVLMPSMFALSESVWDQVASKQHSKEVLVKSISVDGQNILVTVVDAAADSSSAQRETVSLCGYASDDIQTNASALKADLIQQAFTQGHPITVQFSGAFNRCISKVHL